MSKNKRVTHKVTIDFTDGDEAKKLARAVALLKKELSTSPPKNGPGYTEVEGYWPVGFVQATAKISTLAKIAYAFTEATPPVVS